MMDENTFRITGYHVFWSLVVFFGVIFCANAVMLTLAMNSFTGDHIDQAYARGLDYNSTIEKRAASQALGWEMSTRLIREQNVLSVTLKNQVGEPIVGVAVRGELIRPVQAKMDRRLEFTQVSLGVFEAEVSNLAPGRWAVQIRAELPSGDLFEARQDL